MTASLGISLGSTSVKVCLLAEGGTDWAEVRPHNGDVRGVLRAILSARGVEPGIPTIVTGHEARRQARLGGVVKAVAFEHALAALTLDVQAIVSVGGEDLGVYTVGAGHRIQGSITGSKCAAGTGEFFVQQLRRMDLDVEAVLRPEVFEARPRRLSSRCSVFMKSDCTHALNKGEATREDIVLSLCQVMAGKVQEYLAKARVNGGVVLLAGGAFRNPHLVRFVREQRPDAVSITIEQSAYLEAFGAAHLARTAGTPLPAVGDLFEDSAVAFARTPPLGTSGTRVTLVPSSRTHPRADRQYVLAIDGGSTTTKAAIIGSSSATKPW